MNEFELKQRQLQLENCPKWQEWACARLEKNNQAIEEWTKENLPNTYAKIYQYGRKKIR
jgi:hypothetical protein